MASTEWVNEVMNNSYRCDLHTGENPYDECHTKIDLFEVKKIGKFSVFKIV